MPNGWSSLFHVAVPGPNSPNTSELDKTYGALVTQQILDLFESTCTSHFVTSSLSCRQACRGAWGVRANIPHAFHTRRSSPRLWRERPLYDSPSRSKHLSTSGCRRTAPASVASPSARPPVLLNATGGISQRGSLPPFPLHRPPSRDYHLPPSVVTGFPPPFPPPPPSQ